jgi:hypothetical protein
MIITNDLIKEANIVSPSFIGNRLALDALNPVSYPGTGNSWFDLSGNNNTITLYGSPTYADGALVFDGTTQYAKRTSTPSLNIDGGGSAITIEVWMKVDDAANNYIMCNKGPYTGGASNQNGNYAFWLFASSTSFISTGPSLTNANNLRLDTSYLTTSWRQYVITYSNPYCYLYIDGVLVSRVLRYNDSSDYGYYDMFRTPEDFWLTGRVDGFGYLDGSLSVVNIFDHVLSEDQVLKNYNYYSPRYA